MKPILEYLYNRKGAIKNINNRFNITKKDLIGDLKRFPVGVVVRMLEEQELQGNKPDVTVFQKYICSSKDMDGFTWSDTEDRQDFWRDVIGVYNFDLFYKNYPEYKKI